MRVKTTLLACAVVAALTGCQRPRPIPEQAVWNGTVDLDEGIRLPFRVSLDLSAGKFSGYFLVGDEKTPIPEIIREGDSLVFGFSEYGAEMRGMWNGSEWSGDYIRYRSSGNKSLKFTAAPAAAAPPAPAAPVAPLTGNFQVAFDRDGQVDETTVAKFWAQDGALYGTFIAPDGDYGLLAGEPVANGFHLHRFNGWQATVITLEPTGEGWSGTFYAASNDKPQSFVLKPRADLHIAIPATMQTAIRNPNAGFAFEGMALTGETVRHTGGRFKGKALIVDIMGTWCHNCLDEAPVLEQLQKEYGKDGLEIIGLSFEISDNPEAARKNLTLYRDRFGLTYTLLFCGSLEDRNIDKQLRSQLVNFFAYPTTIFIDRSGKVQAVHSGFKGPGTGEEFQFQVRDFHELTRKLLNAR